MDRLLPDFVEREGRGLSITLYKGEAELVHCLEVPDEGYLEVGRRYMKQDFMELDQPGPRSG